DPNAVSNRERSSSLTRFSSRKCRPVVSSRAARGAGARINSGITIRKRDWAAKSRKNHLNAWTPCSAESNAAGTQVMSIAPTASLSVRAEAVRTKSSRLCGYLDRSRRYEKRPTMDDPFIIRLHMLVVIDAEQNVAEAVQFRTRGLG